jgi:hypothetical protein
MLAFGSALDPSGLRVPPRSFANLSSHLSALLLWLCDTSFQCNGTELPFSRLKSLSSQAAPPALPLPCCSFSPLHPYELGILPPNLHSCSPIPHCPSLIPNPPALNGRWFVRTAASFPPALCPLPLQSDPPPAINDYFFSNEVMVTSSVWTRRCDLARDTGKCDSAGIWKLLVHWSLDSFDAQNASVPKGMRSSWPTRGWEA